MAREDIRSSRTDRTQGPCHDPDDSPGGGACVVELHNALNSSASQNSVGTATQNFATQAAFDTLVVNNLTAKFPTGYFGRVQEIVAPRVLKIGFKLEF